MSLGKYSMLGNIRFCLLWHESAQTLKAISITGAPCLGLGKMWARWRQGIHTCKISNSRWRSLGIFLLSCNILDNLLGRPIPMLLFFSLALVCPAFGLNCCFGVPICMLVSLSSPDTLLKPWHLPQFLAVTYFRDAHCLLKPLMLPEVLFHVDIAFDTRVLPLTVDTEQSVRISSRSPQPLNIVIGLWFIIRCWFSILVHSSTYILYHTSFFLFSHEWVSIVSFSNQSWLGNL